MEKKKLFGLSREELDQFIDRIGEKPYRAFQIWSWLYQKGVSSFEEMTNISRPFRQKLDAIAEICSPKRIRQTQSAGTGTQKFLWELGDGHRIESVYIPDGKRRTICISSQVGCPLKCDFCATGKMGFYRNLQTHEIVGQALSMMREIGQRPTNLVVMGMGEPFLNYDAVVKALAILNHGDGTAIGQRKITISTAGLVPGILRYIEEQQPFQLAISLNATTDSLRNRLMPVNKKYPLAELLKAARTYSQKQKKRITFEYVLFRGINDSHTHAKQLLKMLHGIRCKVNLIACNAVSRSYQRPDDDHIRIFAEWIRPLCAPVTLRLSRGDDIQGACGQLAVQDQPSSPV